MNHVCILMQVEYKPGDQPPDGYLAWHEWAEVQRKAGIKQVQCGECGKWKTPQELSDASITSELIDRRGRFVVAMRRICNKCSLDKEMVRPTK
jgi:hypothetical protein